MALNTLCRTTKPALSYLKSLKLVKSVTSKTYSYYRCFFV